MTVTSLSDLASQGLSLLTTLRTYDFASGMPVLFHQTRQPFHEQGSLACDDIRLTAVSHIRPIPGAPEGILLTVTFTAQTACTGISLALELDNDRWSRDNYVLVPGAIYQGNRFEPRFSKYPPIFESPDDIRPDAPTRITDVPRLALGTEPSRFQLLARDAVTPAIGFYCPASQIGVLLLTQERTGAGPTGLSIAESDDESRTQATLSVVAPGVREGLRFANNSIQQQSSDRGVDLAIGESITLQVALFLFPCVNIPALFTQFSRVRKTLSATTALAMELPFSHAWSILEEKYTRENWQGVGDYDFSQWSFAKGYYTVGTDRGKYGDFQIGWVGGAINTYPLLLQGSETSCNRSLATLDWLFANGQAESGYFKSVGFRGDWYDDGFGKAPANTDFHLIRKSADALYFLFKQFNLLKAQGKFVPKTWEIGARRCADAFVRTWETFGQWGQFVSERTGDVLVGNSAAAGIAPAALCLAAEYFQEPRYRAVAESGGRFLYENFTQKGMTTGGPGEILQCPDSESAYGLLESFVVLGEASHAQEWRVAAEDAARQCASWHVSYDFAYPKGSEFERLGLKSTGAVLANVQNKHGAPGICTLSGDSLFKLFRWTGDLFYLTLLQETARNLTQYLSRSDRPIHDPNGRAQPAGYINERVNLSDWDNNVGGIFYGSTWAEVSLLLTIVEIPGVYVQPDTGLCVAFDSVEVTLLTPTGLRFYNPTNYPAQVSILCETSETARHQALALKGTNTLPQIQLMPGETRDVVLSLLS